MDHHILRTFHNPQAISPLLSLNNVVDRNRRDKRFRHTWLRRGGILVIMPQTARRRHVHIYLRHPQLRWGPRERGI